MLVNKNNIRSGVYLGASFAIEVETLAPELFDLGVKSEFLPVGSKVGRGRSVYIVDDTKNMVGAFKVRGAYNAIKSRSSSRAGLVGLFAASSGSFGMACSYCASLFGLIPKIFVPFGTPSVKISKLRALGADLTIVGSSYEAAKLEAERNCNQHRQYYFQNGVDMSVFVGNGTLGLELVNFFKSNGLSGRTAVVVPLGIGSLLIPIASYIHARLSSHVDIVSVEPVGFSKIQNANLGLPIVGGDTVAGGASVRSFPQLSLEYVYRAVDYYFGCDEALIIDAMYELRSRYSLISEGAGALSYACFKNNANFFSAYDNVFILLTGGNVG